MNPRSYTGACLCGTISYRIDVSDEVVAVHCHCDDCRRATGSAFATVLGVPEGDFHLLVGYPKGYRVTGASGGAVERQFCVDCGSPLFTIAALSPGVVFVKAGSLDDASWLHPALACWTDRAQAWGNVSEVPGVAGNP